MKTKKNKAKATEKKVLGRPKKEVQRMRRISIRVSDEDMEQIHRIAKRDGKSIANCVRERFELDEDSYGKGGAE